MPTGVPTMGEAPVDEGSGSLSQHAQGRQSTWHSGDGGQAPGTLVGRGKRLAFLGVVAENLALR